MPAGKDFSLSYQHFTALDNVQFVNGNQLGSRALFQVGHEGRRGEGGEPAWLIRWVCGVGKRDWGRVEYV